MKHCNIVQHLAKPLNAVQHPALQHPAKPLNTLPCNTCNRDEDMEVNPCKEKKLTNVRSVQVRSC